MEVDPPVDSDIATRVHGTSPSTGTRLKAPNLGQLGIGGRPKRPLFTSMPAIVPQVNAQGRVTAQRQIQPSIAQVNKGPVTPPLQNTGTRVNTKDKVQSTVATAKQPITPSVQVASTLVNVQDDQVQPTTTQGTKRPITTSLQVAKKQATNSMRETRAMKYDSKKNCYYVLVAGEPAETHVVFDSNTLNRYDQSLIQSSTRNPDIWVGASIPSAAGRDLGIGVAPVELWTEVISRYQRHDQPNCPYYPMANALFYAEYEHEAEELFNTATTIVSIERERQIGALLSFVPNRLPIIGWQHD